MEETIHRPPYAFDLRGIFAFAIYLALAAMFFARGLDGRFSTAYVGKGVDPPQLMWLMAWWPHAIAHGLNPLFTDAIWAPRGLNLAWATTMPLLSLVAAVPVAFLGPVAIYNLCCLFALALAAWSAFVLCRYLTSAYCASLAGGYVFGFCAYTLGQTLAHLNLLLVFPIPLFWLLMIRGFRVDIAWRPLLAGLTLVLAALFLMFIELFATMTLFAGIAFIVVLGMGTRAEKTRAVNLLPTVALAYAIALGALSPFFYYMVALGYDPGATHPALLYSTDLLNLAIPTSTMELGRAAPFRAITERFLGFIFEDGGYIGVPLMLISVAFARRNWTEGWARALVTVLIVAVILSLGPFLVVGGRPIIPLPGLLLGAMPLIGKALPVRLMLYAFLALAVITALWLGDSAFPRWVRVAAALAVIVSIAPNLSASFWTSALYVPPFFSDGLYAKYLSPGETVVVLPYGINGNSMAWQLQSGWYFKMAGGYAGNPPVEFRQWPIVRAFYRVGTVALPDAGDQLKAFLATHRATAVLVDDREADIWRPLMATLNTAPVEAGAMTIYRAVPAELAPWRSASALEMETRLDKARFAALVLAAERYLHAGRPADGLTPAAVSALGLMPAGWIVIPEKVEPPWNDGGLNLPRHPSDTHQLDDLWLRVDEQGRIEAGVNGWYPSLRAVLSDYRADAVGFLPRDLDRPAPAAEADLRGRLVVVFSREGLERAAARVRSEGNNASAAPNGKDGVSR